jgi:glycosyltransferase involved in cell wall biosynthesis
MLKHKGVEEFVAAAMRLGRDGVHARFLLAGDSDPANPASISREQLDVWHRSGAVEWLGFQNDMAGLMRRAHIVCLPSYGEGMPKVLLEALASARPIVTTDVPGCRELIADGGCGLLVPVRNPAALANALRRLIEDGDQRVDMGRRGRALAEAQFGVERVVEATLAVYRELIPQ